MAENSIMRSTATSVGVFRKPTGEATERRNSQPQGGGEPGLFEVAMLKNLLKKLKKMAGIKTKRGRKYIAK